MINQVYDINWLLIHKKERNIEGDYTEKRFTEEGYIEEKYTRDI